VQATGAGPCEARFDLSTGFILSHASDGGRAGGTGGAAVAFAEVNISRGKERGTAMSDEHVYKIVQIAGSSSKSIDDAIQNAVSKASKSLKNLRWFEVIETRGHIDDGRVAHYQVVLKVGFTLND
jgi:flavin-binding protein dodecin